MNNEVKLNDNFCELSNEEMMAVDGGGAIIGFLVGVVGSAAIDAVLKEETGKGLSEWSQMGYRKAKKAWKDWEETGGAFGLLVDALGW